MSTDLCASGLWPDARYFPPPLPFPFPGLLPLPLPGPLLPLPGPELLLPLFPFGPEPLQVPVPALPLLLGQLPLFPPFWFPLPGP